MILIKYTKKFFFYYIIILLCSSISADRYTVQLPKEPIVPTIETSQQKSTKKNNVKTMQLSIIATLGSHEKVKGEIFLPERIEFKHIKKGLIFKKEIQPSQISFIQINSYSYRIIKKRAKETLYEMRPNAVSIKLKNGRIYTLNYIFKFLEKFSIITEDGTTTLFTFFADTYHHNKGWLHAKKKSYHYHKKSPHEKAIYKISFPFIKKNII